MVDVNLLNQQRELHVRNVLLRQEDDLQSTREKLAKIILDEMVQFVALLRPDGTLLEVNRAALEGGGIALADIQGKPFWEAHWWTISAETQAQLQVAIQAAARGEFVRYDVEVYGSKSGLDPITIDFSMIPVKDQSGNVVFIVPEGRNVTDRVLANQLVDEKNRALEDMLEQVRSLDVLKNQFFANVSHELRTPLTLILGPAKKLLASPKELNREQRSDIETISRNAAQLLKQVNDLLDASKIDAHKMDVHYVKADAGHSVRLIAGLFETVATDRRILFDVQTTEDLSAEFDQDKLERILLNLLSNAFKFTPDGGNIELCAEVDANGKVILLKVRDSGPGIPDDKRSTIFERFVQLDGGTTRAAGGTGLGLSILHEFVRLHGGTIQVGRSCWGGAEFEIRLPRYAPAGATVSEKAEEASQVEMRQDVFDGTVSAVQENRPLATTSPKGTDGTRPIVVLAEDNTDLRAFLCTSLAPYFDVVATSNGIECLDKLKTVEADVVLTDIMMPRMGGDELVAQIRANRAYDDMPIMLLSAKADSALRIRLLKQGAQDFCIKPFDIDEIIARLGNLAALSISRRQARTQMEALKVLVGEMDDLTVSNKSILSIIQNHRVVSFTDLDGVITEVNDAFCTISGYSREELVGNNHRIINSGTHSKAFFSAMWQMLKQGKSWQGEICNRGKDGQLYWVDSIIAPVRGSNGAIERYVSIRSDITQRKLQSVALRKSQAFLDQTGRLAGVGGWEVDVATGAVVWSDETCRIHEVPPGYAPTVADVIHFYAPEARPVVQRAVEEGLKNGKSWEFELPLITAKGRQIWVRAVGKVEFENGVPRRMVGAFQDITETYLQRKRIADIRNRFELATRSGHIGVWEYSLVDGHLSWSDEMYSIYSLSSTVTSVSYDFWAKFIHPEDRASFEAAIQKAIDCEIEIQLEFRVVLHDGSIHYQQVEAMVERDTNGDALRLVGVSRDISKQRDAEMALARQNELLQVTMRSIGDSVITTDAEGCVTWLNPVAERMTGWLSAEAAGRPLGQVFHIVNEETRLPTENPVNTCLKQGKVVGLANHTLLISRFGEEFGIEDSAAPIRAENGEVLGVVLVFHDVTEQRRMSGEMSYRATHDALTGLVNRAEFETRLRRLLQKSHEDGSHHAMMFIDLDQFKLVNDACGHSAGDQLLKQVSKLLGEAVRSRDTLARLGGDEFAVILDHCPSEQAQRIAQQICDRMEEFRFQHDDRRFRIGTSIGLVAVSKAFPTAAAVMQAADTACYAAKEAGRNRVHTWFDTDKALRERHGEMQWTTRIEQALDEDRFVLFSQRIFAVNEGNDDIHEEVLLRMVDQDGSIINPGAFIPAAERFNLISRIDRWVLRQTIEWLQMYGESGDSRTLSVNLSGQSVGDRAFHRHVIEKLGTLEPKVCQHLCFEITETAAVTNLADAALFIEQVRAFGVRISLDDFGAGASSFGYLKSLHVDYLKIDGQFIKDLLEDPLDHAAVKSFVDVASVVGVKTVAEFVDREDVLQRVRDLGIDYAQGFHLHRPEPLQRDRDLTHVRWH